MIEKNSSFVEFVKEVEEKVVFRELTKLFEEMHGIKTHRIEEISGSEAIQLYDSIHQKFYKFDSGLLTSTWFENELRLFLWALVAYLGIHTKSIEELNELDWKFFSALFPHKDEHLFEYQVKAISSPLKAKPWEKEEEDLLRNIMLYKFIDCRIKKNKNKWNEVSKEMYQRSNKTYFRTAKQCREKWNNHLDPSKIKGFWKSEECLLMFEYVRKNGKKWANLVKVLSNTRNEHSIKNKFNSLIRKHKKLIEIPLSDDHLYDDIICRIKKTILNKINYDNADASFEFEEFDSSDVSRKLDPSTSSCHEITKNFLRILHNYNPGESDNIKTSETYEASINCREHSYLIGSEKTLASEAYFKQSYQTVYSSQEPHLTSEFLSNNDRLDDLMNKLAEWKKE